MGIFKIKCILILFVGFFLCGCSATYELEIKDNIVIENALLNEKKNSINYNSAIINEIDLAYNSIHDINNGQEEVKTKSFDIKKIDDNINLGLKYKNEFSLDNYDMSPILYQCYENVNIYNNDDYININTSSYFKCFDYYKYLDEVIIKLKTDYKIDSSNSDEVGDNVLYWYIDKDNYLNKTIKVKISKNEKNFSFIENIKQEDNSFIFMGIIGIGILISIVVIYEKVKNSNK